MANFTAPSMPGLGGGVGSSLAAKDPATIATIANIASILTADKATVEASLDTVGAAAYDLQAGDRVLVKNQTNQVENGIYQWTGTGLIRARDFDTSAEIQGGVQIVVGLGDNHAGEQWIVVGFGPRQPDIDPIQWQLVVANAPVSGGGRRVLQDEGADMPDRDRVDHVGRLVTLGDSPTKTTLTIELPVEVSLPFSAAIAWNVNLNPSAAVTLAGDATVNANSMVNGHYYFLAVNQDATGGWKLTSGTGFEVTETLPISPDPIDTSVLVYYAHMGVMVRIGARFGALAYKDTVEVGDLDPDTVGATELIATGVTPAAYTAPNVTIDADGRITLAANNTLGALAALNTVGPAEIEPTGIAAAAYSAADITVDEDGRLTAATSNTLGALAALNTVGPAEIDPTGITPAVYGAATITVDADGRLTNAVTNSLGALAALNTVGPTEIENTTVIAGTYTAGTFTVDADGRLTAASANTLGALASKDTVGSSDIDANAVGPAQLQSTAVTPGPYLAADITVDADGRITAASNHPLGALAVLDTVGSAQIDNDAVGPAQLASTSVIPGPYTAADITVDADGRITSASGNTLGALAPLDTVGTAVLEDDAVTNQKVANMAANTIKMRVATAGDPQDINIDNLSAHGAPAAGDLLIVQQFGGNLVKVDINDLPSSGGGTGDVTGPASAVDQNIAVFQGTSGKAIADGGVKASDFLTTNVTDILTGNGEIISYNLGAYSVVAAGTNGHPLLSAGGTAAASFGQVGSTGIADTAITNAKLSNMAAYSIKMNATAGSNAPQDLKPSSLTDQPSPSAGDVMVGESGGALVKIDVGNLPFGDGDVTGPNGALDENIAVFDQTSGKLIKDGLAKVADFLTTNPVDILINPGEMISHSGAGVYSVVAPGTLDHPLVSQGGASPPVFSQLAKNGIENNAIDNEKLSDMAQNAIKMRAATGTGDPEDIAIAALTEHLTPSAGDWLLGQVSGGNLARIDVGNLPSGGGSPNPVIGNFTSTGGTVTVDLAGIDVAYVTCNQATVTVTFTNGVAGKSYTVGFIDTLGSLTLSPGVNTNFGTDITSYQTHGAANQRHYYAVHYYQPGNQYDVIAFVRGFS